MKEVQAIFHLNICWLWLIDLAEYSNRIFIYYCITIFFSRGCSTGIVTSIVNSHAKSPFNYYKLLYNVYYSSPKVTFWEISTVISKKLKNIIKKEHDVRSSALNFTLECAYFFKIIAQMINNKSRWRLRNCSKYVKRSRKNHIWISWHLQLAAQAAHFLAMTFVWFDKKSAFQ